MSLGDGLNDIKPSENMALGYLLASHVKYENVSIMEKTLVWLFTNRFYIRGLFMKLFKKYCPIFTTVFYCNFRLSVARLME